MENHLTDCERTPQTSCQVPGSANCFSALRQVSDCHNLLRFTINVRKTQEEPVVFTLEQTVTFESICLLFQSEH